jgi:hypothetical protein
MWNGAPTAWFWKSPKGKSDFDFLAFKGRGFLNDLQRRDFTINAMALPWKNGEIPVGVPSLIDPTGGLADLQKPVAFIACPPPG